MCGLLLAHYVELCVCLRGFVCWYVFVCFVYDASCGVVWFACVCLSLCAWLLVLETECLAAVSVSYCVVMCDVAWSVYLFFCFVCDLLLA